MTDLSSAARAVLDAVLEICPAPADEIVAAALRAAADRANPINKYHIQDISYQPYVDGWEDALEVILAVAAELERADLDQPEPEGPTDKDLLELMPESMHDEFSYAAKVCSDATGGQVKPGIFRVALNTAALEYAQAVLAKYGN